MTRADWRLAAAVTIIGVLGLLASVYVGRATHGAPGTLIVETDGRPTMRLSVSGAVQRVKVKGVQMTIEVGGGRARVVSSNCPNKLCIAAGYISRPGQSIVCVPNRTVFRLTGRGGPDAVSQ